MSIPNPGIQPKYCSRILALEGSFGVLGISSVISGNNGSQLISFSMLKDASSVKPESLIFQPQFRLKVPSFLIRDLKFKFWTTVKFKFHAIYSFVTESLTNPILGHLHSISIFFWPNNFSLLLHLTVHFRNLVDASMTQLLSILSSSNFNFSGSHVMHFESSSAFHLYFPFSFCLHFTLLLAFDT